MEYEALIISQSKFKDAETRLNADEADESQGIKQIVCRVLLEL